MSLTPRPTTVHWYRSFYFRIGLSFVVFVVAVILAQSVMFRFALRFVRPQFPGRPPNTVAAIVATDLGSALTQDPDLDIEDYLKREYANAQPIYVVMRDGSIVANRSEPLQDEIARSVEGVLSGTDWRRLGREPPIRGMPFVMAPVQVSSQLRAMVVLPPSRMPGPPIRDVGRVLLLPGTVLLIVATVIAATFIFRPARRRLEALRDATRRLGAGDLSARAPDHGGDEIAEVATTFNMMAEELAAREEALRTSDRLRRQMLADVSHELKTPLTAMRGYVETLRMSAGAVDAATRDRYFATLERETIRLERIVKDLLDLARLENGVGDLEIRVFDINRVFEHVVGRHEHELSARSLHVKTAVADEADQVVGDPDRIEQVIENLFANALRHTPDRGSIELHANANDKSVVLQVIDSGTGIPSAHVAHVFERFYKVDASRANGSDGSGLGLSIAKAIIERHGGTIGVDSAPGHTVFTMTLPQEGRRPPHAASSASANL